MVKNLCINKHTLGFTLTEVLVTLAIIGIVAALTVPSLVTNIQDQQYRAAWKKSYSVISQAFMQIKSDNGDFNFIVNDSQSLYTVLPQYLKVAKLCGTDASRLSCFIYNNTTPAINYKALAGGTVDYHNFRDGQFYLIDGSFFIVHGELNLKHFWVDVNGPSKGPNVLGKDVYGVEVLRDQILPLGATGTGQFEGTCTNSYKFCGGADTYWDSDCSGAGCSAQYLTQ